MRDINLAPPEHLEACVRVLYIATLRARSLGWEGEAHGITASACKELVTLMDAIHNIPHIVLDWKAHGHEVREMLERYDSRYKANLIACEGAGLGGIYDRVVAGVTRQRERADRPEAKSAIESARKMAALNGTLLRELAKDD